MKLNRKVITLFVAAIPFLIPLNAFAQELSLSHRLDNAYDNGYDDGYDDAMKDCPCPPKNMLGGWYLGAAGGYEGFQTVRKPFIDNDYIGTLNTHANGWNGRLFGGYGNYFKYWYMGIEGFVGTSSASGTDFINLNGYRGRISAENTYGLSVTPGIKIGSPLLFTRLGAVKTQFQVNDSIPGVSSSSKHWTSGFNAGLGVEMPLMGHITGRFEYDYIKYSSFDVGGNVGSINAPVDNLALLGIRYTF